MMRILRMPTLFTATSEEAMRVLGAAIRGWEGTPHVAGQRTPGKGGGVDCINFVAAVLEECYLGAQPSLALPDAGPIPRPPQDLGAHDADGARWGEVVAWFRRRFPARAVLSDPMGLVAPRRAGRLSAPGDVLVMTPSKGARGVNHVGICGEAPGSVWHAGGWGVTEGSLGDPELCARVREIYRPLALVAETNGEGG